MTFPTHDDLGTNAETHAPSPGEHNHNTQVCVGTLPEVKGRALTEAEFAELAEDILKLHRPDLL